ncbi:MAG: hypothetical protein U9R03_04540 [Candidatus Aerophobetes bacterium]|nr:hypothetical protein [Candidatus Aerophobetes bacterium]
MNNITYKNLEDIEITFSVELPEKIYTRLNLFGFSFNNASINPDEFSEDIEGMFEYKILLTAGNELASFIIWKKYIDESEDFDTEFNEIITNYNVSYNNETGNFEIEYIKIEENDQHEEIKRVTEYLEANPGIAQDLVEAFSTQTT